MSLHCCSSINTQGQRGGGKVGAWFLPDKAGQRCAFPLKLMGGAVQHIRGECNPKGRAGVSSSVTPIKGNRSHVAETHTQISEHSPPEPKNIPLKMDCIWWAQRRVTSCWCCAGPGMQCWFCWDTQLVQQTRTEHRTPQTCSKRLTFGFPGAQGLWLKQIPLH